jgi:hypothetical protein
MAYTITLTDGTVFATIADGTINTASGFASGVPLTLVGKNYAGYGEFLNENYIHLLENGSNTTAPSAPLTGQLWWDKTNSLLKVYNGSVFKTISAATSSSTAPTSNVTGDLWYDTVNQQLKVWSGAAFIVVGPAFSSSQGTSGAIPETIADSVGATKFITSIYVNNNRVAIAYDGAQFVPQASLLSTFPIIYPGITLTTTNSPIFAGTANNASFLNSLQSSQFMRSDANTSTTGILRVLNDSGLFVGSTNAVSVTQSTNDGLLRSTISGANLIIQSNVGGTIFNVASALGANGTFAIANAATVGTSLSATGNVTGGNINTAGLVSATGNVRGGNVVAVATISAGGAVIATGNITGGNISSGNSITAGTTISAAGNITAGSGAFFIGNGSQLTGLSAAISVTKIENGTSTVQIGASGGNANVSIGGTSNVVVFTNSTTFFAGSVSVPSIDKTGSNAVGNIGSSSNYFNRVFATATTALYADVAERFAADEILAPGTVVELGGSKEITRARDDLTECVFGVISTRPAYTMNGGAGDDDTHPAVAMTGRVPVQVVGAVRKGDRLVSAGNGYARSAKPGEATAFNVIGRALVDKLDPDQGTIEAIVTIK